MTATMTLTKPRATPQPTTGQFLWYLVPLPVRAALRARVPLDGRMKDGGESLLVSVGPGVPLQWLHLEADDAGVITCRLWEVRKKTKEIGRETVHPDRLPALLQTWAVKYGLSAN